MADASEILYSGRKQQIVFRQPYGGTVAFKAFITNYSESWSNSWEEKELVRRLNKQYTFNAVYRTIQLGWSLPAYSVEEASDNLKKCTQFTRMLYPLVDERGTVVGSNPIWFMSLMNFVHNSNATTGGSADSETLHTTGLKGFPSNFTWEPVLEEGVFDTEAGVVLPKIIRVSCNYNVLVDETKRFGWTTEGGWATESEHWPYYPGDPSTFPPGDATLVESLDGAAPSAADEIFGDSGTDDGSFTVTVDTDIADAIVSE
tara:strand:+ start:8963 stop:9739 length:777 start_codon:yes stop_codon:yes gene_type:complete